MTAPLTLDVAALLALPAKVAQLEAKLAQFEQAATARDPNELIDVATGAAELSVTTKTVYRWIWSGKLPRHGIGRAVRIRRADLLAVRK